MKRMNYKQKLILYFIICSLLISSFLLYSPETHVFSATGEPEITVMTPAAEAVLDVSTVEFTGKVSDDQTPSNELVIKVFEQSEDSEQPIDITDDGKLTITPKAEYADFTYLNEFSNGIHKLTFFVSDQQGFSSKVEQTFTVMLPEKVQGSESENAASDGTTNSVETTDATVETANNQTNLETNLRQPAAIESSTAESSTNNLITNQLDANESTGNQPAVEEIGNRPYMTKMLLIPKGTENEYEPDGKVPDGSLPAEDMTRVPLDYQILIEVRSVGKIPVTQPLITVFGEDSNGKEKLIKEDIKLNDNITAYVYTYTFDNNLSPGKTYSVYLDPNFENDSKFKIIPRFLKFTTVSANHQDVKGFSLKDGETIADIPDSQRSIDFNIHGNYSNVTNACAYCHSTHNGKNATLEGGTITAKADNLCLACHDGTLASAGIPAAEKYYSSDFKHAQGQTKETAACTSCHNPHIPGTPDNPNSLKSDSRLKPFSYKKASSATGDAEDFSLCFSCHDGSKGKDIKQYYKNDNFLSQSGHNLTKTADSGTKLIGQLPCAECHETHGSNNIQMLRSNLGNIEPAKNKSKFLKDGGDWDASAQREFCLACHNPDNKTVLYGKITTFMEIDSAGNPISGHLKENYQMCSQCHGGGSFIEAAHAPKKILQTTNSEAVTSESVNLGSP
ncbi:cytochrome c3 family protein [Neobacillus kokaensis]|uniref:Doubled CXXCH motif domain-containing protein n=1 Tax=Neobacillus kokaensis TaxID=2759023 RepID=A0ABQ3N8B6_9BACI|nr:cytochrome c3 family protein [Neobacillus kokaensis]GHH97481.1 hypothetical protein AM1BK_10240 [Neobacillus kokaensis]